MKFVLTQTANQLNIINDARFVINEKEAYVKIKSSLLQCSQATEVLK